VNAASRRDVVLAALCSVVPEAGSTDLDPTVEFREQLDFDSLDFLNFVQAIEARTGILVPERDYSQLLTLDFCSAYLGRLSGAAGRDHDESPQEPR